MVENASKSENETEDGAVVNAAVCKPSSSSGNDGEVENEGMNTYLGK